MREWPIRMSVNGQAYEATVEPRLTLADHLRENCGLTGTHLGCEHGACGACTVLVDGQAVRACLMFAVQADGTEVTTIEGLARDGRLHPVQSAFNECHGLQCGYCTPGMIMAAVDLLGDNPDPDEHEVREGIEGNLCRCTGYQNIVRAVQQAAKEMHGSAAGDPDTGNGHVSPAVVDTAAAPHVAGAQS
jgi:carbon-monoxide dehydrogenase small subunit